MARKKVKVPKPHGPVQFRLISWTDRDDGLVTWDPQQRQLRGAGVGAEMLRRTMAKAAEHGCLDTPAGPIKVRDPYSDLSGLVDCIGEHWKVPAHLVPFGRRRRPRRERSFPPGLQILY
ncbi:hypothetical protein ACFOGJ_24100 [Marinibaculum pumilum]|uniref:Uncharacterized protein n=1 Tax=Marinibaculum pumilum TaxID=1766165 RepID=A0ABV7L7L8_9PROT